MVLPGLCGDLQRSGGAESSLFWYGSVSTPEEAREQRRYEVGQEFKTLLVEVGGPGGDLRVLLCTVRAWGVRDSVSPAIFL